MRETRHSVRNVGLWQVLGTEQPDLVKVPWKGFCYYMHCECVPLIEWMNTIKPSTDFCSCWQNCMYYYNYMSSTAPNPNCVKSITYSNFILWIVHFFLSYCSFIYKCGFVLQQRRLCCQNAEPRQWKGMQSRAWCFHSKHFEMIWHLFCRGSNYPPHCVHSYLIMTTHFIWKATVITVAMLCAAYHCKRSSVTKIFMICIQYKPRPCKDVEIHI